MKIFELIVLVILIIAVVVVFAHYTGNALYKQSCLNKDKVSLRFQKKFAYLNDLLDRQINWMNYKEFIQDYGDLRCKSELEHAMKDDLCKRFKFKHASYLVNEETGVI
jgi:hypothetical protein